MAPNPLSFITACLPCLPSATGRKKTATHRAEYYNAQLRSNLGMPERPLRLPVIANAQAERAAAESQQQQQQQPPSNGNTKTSESTGPGTGSRSNQQQQQTPASRRSAPTPRGRFPTAPRTSGTTSSSSRASNNKKKVAWSDTPMETAQLAELFEKLGTLEHIPYAVCGRGALVDHGLSARRAKQVSILVPALSKDVITGWAKSSGWVVRASANNNNNNNNSLASGGGGVFVGVPLASDGSLRQVRVKYIDDARFEQLERVRSRLSGGAAFVLGLASQLDHLAAAWLDHYRQGKEAPSSATGAAGSSSSSKNHEKPLREIARDIMWTLNEMALSKRSGRGGAPDPRFLPTLRSENFFVPFTGSVAEARPGMAAAGIDVGAVLASLRAKRSLREHDEMLARYGADPLLPRSDGRGGGGGDGGDDDLPFNGLMDLNHRKSVYTVSTNISASELASANGGAPPVPASPAKPVPAAAVAESSSGGGGGGERTAGGRARSVRVSGVRPDVVAAIAGAVGGSSRKKEDGALSLQRSSSTTRAPPRRSLIPAAEPAPRSSEWI